MALYYRLTHLLIAMPWMHENGWSSSPIKPFPGLSSNLAGLVVEVCEGAPALCKQGPPSRRCFLQAQTLALRQSPLSCQGTSSSLMYSPGDLIASTSVDPIT